ncbi:dCTP deaminase domain-containing protein [Luteolibacter luteus]|uniref:dUTPase-like domain-containing protein n=1 Tax=Luteolibacter luteus TaxID=2728835 RepID=A0A858RJ48_9BACT|nr:hypothetical protein [Luteolibacter luteus]QJE96240.1 hypothetical protein HHL09_10745 [Luteolibacter luteus]
MIILRREFQDRGIEIDPLVTEAREEVCADLHVGTIYMEAGSSENLTMPDKFQLKPGRCIIITTQERLAIPSRVFGNLYSRGSLAARGMLVANTKIDPHFNGELKIAVFNAGKQTLEIERGKPFCSISFQELTDRINSVSPRGGPDISNEKRGKLERFISENMANIVTIIIAVAGSAAVTYVTMKLAAP